MRLYVDLLEVRRQPFWEEARDKREVGDDEGDAGSVGSKTSQGMTSWNAGFGWFLVIDDGDKHWVTVELTSPQNSYLKIKKTLYEVKAKERQIHLFVVVLRK